jgi:hypothetical protein
MILKNMAKTPWAQDLVQRYHLEIDKQNDLKILSRIKWKNAKIENLNFFF